MGARYQHGRVLRQVGAAIALAIVAGPVFLSAQTRPLRLVSTAWPPFTNAPGQSRFALDLVEAALKRIGLTANTSIVDAARFTPALLGGEFDGSAAVWKDDERERALLFSQPYLQNRLILVGRRGGDVRASSLTSLKGKRVAIVEGYSYGDAVADTTGPTFVRSRSEEDSLTQLLKSTVDYALMDELVVQYIISNYPNEALDRLQVGSAPLLIRSLYFAVNRKYPDAESIIRRFNAELSGMIADHTYHRLLHVQWIRADVDGDGVAEYVPGGDRTGPREPQTAYNLFSPERPVPETPAPKQRFYFGGTVYDGWAQVPDRYKALDSNDPDPARSSFTVFRFTW